VVAVNAFADLDPARDLVCAWVSDGWQEFGLPRGSVDADFAEEVHRDLCPLDHQRMAWSMRQRIPKMMRIPLTTAAWVAVSWAVIGGL
jgi:hypothetical protein